MAAASAGTPDPEVACDAALAADQRGQECLGDGDVAEQVDLEQAPPLVDRIRLERHVDPDACVVHERPHRPRVVAHPRGQRPDVVGVGDIDDQRLDTGASNRVGVPVTSNARENVISPPRQFVCSGRADAGGRAGDDGDLSGFG
jgi:hypothetical protein